MFYRMLAGAPQDMCQALGLEEGTMFSVREEGGRRGGGEGEGGRGEGGEEGRGGGREGGEGEEGRGGRAGRILVAMYNTMYCTTLLQARTAHFSCHLVKEMNIINFKPQLPHTYISYKTMAWPSQLCSTFQQDVQHFIQFLEGVHKGPCMV